MNYQEVETFLFNSFADFQKYGQSALNYDLSMIHALCDALGNPQDRFKTIHIAGTNGKGSSSHMLASILMEAGYQVGLYTSPHLKHYTERIKTNIGEISQEYVTDFVNKYLDVLHEKRYSFFEITTAMAFQYFADQKVDYAVIEVGLGGRLDATNVINPILSLITNISFDHMKILGDSLEQIAQEKAGIIKQGVPVVISEYDAITQPVFMSKANEMDVDIFMASKLFHIEQINGDVIVTDLVSKDSYEVLMDLKGLYQLKNLAGVLCVVKVLNTLGVKIFPEAILEGLYKVKKHTRLKGRWQILSNKPLVICDTAHNEAGLAELMIQAIALKKRLTCLVAFTKEKELTKMVEMLPVDARFYVCDVNNPRMRTADETRKAFASMGKVAEKYHDVNEAITTFKKSAKDDECLLVFGSNFLVAEIDDL